MRPAAMPCRWCRRTAARNPKPERGEVLMRDPTSWRLALIAAGIASALMLHACSRSTPPPATAAMPAGAINDPPDFVTLVWRVQAASAFTPGLLYAFLSDGTVIIPATCDRKYAGSVQRFY